MPGAGKSTCVEELESKGIPSAYFGGITIDEVKARGLQVNEANERTVREDIRAKEGKEAYAHRIVAKIEQQAQDGCQMMVVDGLYSWSEYKVFKERFGENAIIIAITAPRKVRHARLAQRPVRPLTDAEVSAREYAEIENLEKGGPIANADYTLTNNSTKQDLLEQLHQVLSEDGLESA